MTPGRVAVDLALLLADGGEAFADLAVLRGQSDLLGPVVLPGLAAWPPCVACGWSGRWCVRGGEQPEPGVLPGPVFGQVDGDAAGVAGDAAGEVDQVPADGGRVGRWRSGVRPGWRRRG